MFCAGEVEAQVGRGEAHHGELADAAVLELRLSEEVDRDERREPDGVEPDVACGRVKIGLKRFVSESR